MSLVAALLLGVAVGWALRGMLGAAQGAGHETPETRAHIAELEQQLGFARSGLQSQTEFAAELEGTVTDLRAQLAAQSTRSLPAASEPGDAGVSAEAVARAVEEATADASAENARLRAELAALRVRLGEREKRLAERDARLHELEGAVTGLERTLAEFERTASDRERTLAEREHTLAERDTALAQVKTTLAETERSLAAMERAKDGQQAETEAQLGEKERFRDMLQRQIRELSQLRGQVRAQEVELVLTRARLEELEPYVGRFEARDREVRDLQHRLAMLKAERARAESGPGGGGGAALDRVTHEVESLREALQVITSNSSRELDTMHHELNELRKRLGLAETEGDFGRPAAAARIGRRDDAAPRPEAESVESALRAVEDASHRDEPRDRPRNIRPVK
jgi:DNA repair exonuclease SbcCD ATPase subunit